MELAEEHHESSTSRVIEQNQRLSRSLLWDLQRRFFEQKGIDAWRQDIVPHYITSNPFIANAYAQVVLGFLRDGHGGSFPFDESQPVYVVELGAGSGRFAFRFLKKLQRLYARSALSDIQVKYVMTDFARRTIDAWQAHSRLQPLVERGQLDYAAFDAVQDREIELVHSGETLSPGMISNPLVVIANYFFDSIPHDAFYIEDGQLYESLVTLTTPDQEPDLADPDLLNRIEIACEPRPIRSSYYGEPAWNDILREYEKRFADTFFLFPVAPMECIRRLSELSRGRLLLVSADKGHTRDTDLEGLDQLVVAVHGSFSMAVNYHALGKYVANQGGVALHSSHHSDSLGVSAFVLGVDQDSIIETRQAYAVAIEEFGPDDYYTLKKGVESAYDTLTVAQIISYLRLSGWDDNLLLGCTPTLLDRVDSLSEAEKQDLSEAIHHVWEMYYPIGEEADLPLNMGMLLKRMGYDADALTFIQRSQI